MLETPPQKTAAGVDSRLTLLITANHTHTARKIMDFLRTNGSRDRSRKQTKDHRFLEDPQPLPWNPNISSGQAIS